VLGDICFDVDAADHFSMLMADESALTATPGR